MAARSASVAPYLEGKVVARGEQRVTDSVASEVSEEGNLNPPSPLASPAPKPARCLMVISHRKPIASTTAVKSPEQSSADPLQTAIIAGVVNWIGPLPIFIPPIKLKGQGELISNIVIDDRGRAVDPFL